MKREKVLEASYQLFKERGVHKTSMLHIARACHVSVWSINLLFKSKKELVVAVFEYILFKHNRHLEVNPALSPTAVIEMKNFFLFIERWLEDLGGEMLAEVKRFSLLVRSQTIHFVETNLIPYMQRVVARGITEGYYRDKINSELYAHTYFHSLRMIVENADFDWGTTEKTLKQLNEIFHHGLLTVKGMQVHCRPN